MEEMEKKEYCVVFKSRKTGGMFFTSYDSEDEFIHNCTEKTHAMYEIVAEGISAKEAQQICISGNTPQVLIKHALQSSIDQNGQINTEILKHELANVGLLGG